MLNILFKIIIASIKIALLSFGGGAAVTSLIHKEYIEKNNFMPENEFRKLVILANAMPGPTILQLTTYVAYYAGSYIGALLNFIIIVFLLPFILILFLQVLSPYISDESLYKISIAIIPGVVAMLFEFILSMLKQDKKINYNWILYYSILISAFVLLLINIDIVLIFLVLIVLLVLFRVK